jgi:hypothetical protein
MNLSRVSLLWNGSQPLLHHRGPDLGYPVLQRFTEAKAIAFGRPHFCYAPLELGKWQAGANSFRAGGAKWGGKMMARVMTKPGKEGRPMILPIGFMGFSFF